MNDLIAKLRDFLDKNNVDALLINSTNEFLVEYNQLECNARYLVTNFSGSTGDALVTKDKVYLFVDGRYHEQADQEVDHSLVSVVKLGIGQSYLKTLVEKIGQNKTVCVVSSKNTNYFVNLLDTEISKNSSKLEYLSFDPVFDFYKSRHCENCNKIVDVPLDIAMYSPDEKFLKLSNSLKENEIAVITGLEDVAYFSNKRLFGDTYSSSFPGKFIFDKEKAILFTDCNVGFLGDNFRVRKFSDFNLYLSNIKNKKILANKKEISALDYFLIDDSNEILDTNKYSTFKTVKNIKEINHFKYAFSQTDKALKIIEQMINSDTEYSEHDYYEALKNSFFNNNAKGLSFKPIIASGTNSSIIHYSSPSKEKLVKDGDFLLVDCGAYYDGGYATDITRTFLKGSPSNEQKKVYTTVLKAFFAGYKSDYTIDSHWFDIDNNARTTINDLKIDGYNFSHSTGHGVGISVHESPPYVGPSDLSKTQLNDSAVFTIEPGIYKENTGGVRLENTVYSSIVDGKVEINTLSQYKFEEKLINYEMLSSSEKKLLEEWQNIYNEQNN